MTAPDPQQQIEQLSEALVRLEREHHRLRCEYRRVCEEIDWRDEKIRVLTRIIVRLGDKN